MLDFLEEASVEGGQARHLAGARQAVDEVVQFLVLDVVLRSSSARRPRARRCINRYCLATRFTVYLDALSLADGSRTISQPTSPPFLLPPFPTQPQPMPLPVSLGFLECLACFFGLLNIALN